MKISHIIEAAQFNKKALQQIFTTSDNINDRLRRQLPVDVLKGKVLGNLFYVKSMRTQLAFDVAMKRLGGEVTLIDHPEAFSSAMTGGSFEDTIRVVSSMVDVIVLRHSISGKAKIAAGVSSAPIINGGDGPDQHPTQALIDLYSIEKLKGGIDGVSIAFVGDLRGSRTVRSLVFFLAKYSGIKLYFASPRILAIPDDLKGHLKENGVSFREFYDDAVSFRDLLPRVDLIYMTQIPLDFSADCQRELACCRQNFRLTADLLPLLKKDTYIMHPLPRGEELSPEVDQDPRARYFALLPWGQLLRMGLLCTVLGVTLE